MPSTTLKLLETPEAIIASVKETYPEIEHILDQAARLVKNRKQSIQDYQAAVLYLLAEPYNGETIVELGTMYGYSTAILAQACPNSNIFTVEANAAHCKKAKKNLNTFENVQIMNIFAVDFAEAANDGKVGFLFVDANHTQAHRDMAAWWNKLRTDGLVVFHDYAIEKYPAVYAAAHEHGEPDIIVEDTVDEYGMAGVYKHG